MAGEMRLWATYWTDEDEDADGEEVTLVWARNKERAIAILQDDVADEIDPDMVREVTLRGERGFAMTFSGSGRRWTLDEASDELFAILRYAIPEEDREDEPRDRALEALEGEINIDMGPAFKARLSVPSRGRRRR